MKSNIFISYSRKDIEKVKHIKAEIEKSTGLTCWMDMHGIAGGEEFEDVIIAAIDKADIILFMMSRYSMQSPNTKKEIRYANETGKSILPVNIDGSELTGWYLYTMGGRDIIDYRNADQKEKLMKNLLDKTDEIEVKDDSKEEKSPIEEKGLENTNDSCAKNSSDGSSVHIPDNSSQKPKASSYAKIKAKYGYKPLYISCLLAVVLAAAIIYFTPLRYILSKPANSQINVEQSYNNVKAVDLKLPSGTLWADRNIGAKEYYYYGAYYAWGTTNLNISTFKEDSYNNVNCANIARTKNDVAYTQWHGKWQLPAKAQFEELLDTNNCKWEMVKIEGIKGYKVTSKRNGNFIFLPFGGYIDGRNKTNRYRLGFYWTGDSGRSVKVAKELRISHNDIDFNKVDNGEKYKGRNVRAIKIR